MDFIINLNQALQNNDSDFLFGVIGGDANATFKRMALERLLEIVGYNNDIQTFISNLDITEREEYHHLIEPYISNITPIGNLLDEFRTGWKNLQLDGLGDLFRVIVDDSDKQDITTAIYTMINNAYTPEQQELLRELLDDIYDFLLMDRINNASTRDIQTILFRTRNKTLGDRHAIVFVEKVGTMVVAKPDLAWRWVCDALEFSRQEYKHYLWSYLVNWIDEPPFINVTVRNRLKYQIWVCELLLQTFDQLKVLTATEFLLTIAENTDYSTYIRGDAMDVLLRNAIPEEYKERIQTVHLILENTPEHHHRNQMLFKIETGGDIVIQPQYTHSILGTSFNNAQNVHITPINDTINKSVIALIDDPEVRGHTIYKVVDDIKSALNDANVDSVKRNVAIDALTRFISDPAVFTDRHIKLSGILVAVWNRIFEHSQREELVLRLADELSEAYGTCATGHLSRIVSVLAGYYPDISQFNSYTRQLEDNILARIYTIVKNADDDVKGDLLIGMYDKDCEEHFVYVNYLEKYKTKIHDELFREFVEEYISADSFEIIFSMTFPQMTSAQTE